MLLVIYPFTKCPSLAPLTVLFYSGLTERRMYSVKYMMSSSYLTYLQHDVLALRPFQLEQTLVSPGPKEKSTKPPPLPLQVQTAKVCQFRPGRWRSTFLFHATRKQYFHAKIALVGPMGL